MQKRLLINADYWWIMIKGDEGFDSFEEYGTLIALLETRFPECVEKINGFDILITKFSHQGHNFNCVWDDYSGIIVQFSSRAAFEGLIDSIIECLLLEGHFTVD